MVFLGIVAEAALGYIRSKENVGAGLECPSGGTMGQMRPGMRPFVPAHAAPSERQPEALWFIFLRKRMLVATDGGSVEIPSACDPAALGLTGEREVYLGMLENRQCYAAELSEDSRVPEGIETADLRSLFERLPDDQVAVASRASQLLNWHRNQRYCGRCGGATTDKRDETAKVCSSCGLVVYPRISPAIIVLIVRAGRVLLARAPRFRQGMYSVLAGFVEPGETLEECVRREVLEEVGIQVRNIRYFGSQSWPFPDSLMVAFTAEYAGGEIRTDPAELVDAGWYGPQDLPRVPGRISIARRLIDHFLDGSRPQPDDAHQ